MKIWSWLKAKWNNSGAAMEVQNIEGLKASLVAKSGHCAPWKIWKGAEPLLTSHERDRITGWRARLG
jgi:hypothetical protein